MGACETTLLTAELGCRLRGRRAQTTTACQRSATHWRHSCCSSLILLTRLAIRRQGQVQSMIERTGRRHAEAAVRLVVATPRSAVDPYPRRAATPKAVRLGLLRIDLAGAEGGFDVSHLGRVEARQMRSCDSRAEVDRAHLDRLVGAASDEPGARLVERADEDAALGIERTRVRDVLDMLEGLPGRVVPESDRSVVGCKRRNRESRQSDSAAGRRVWNGHEAGATENEREQDAKEGRTSRKQHAVLVDTHRVDDGIVAGKVVDERSLGALPLFDAAGAIRSRVSRAGQEGQPTHARKLTCCRRPSRSQMSTLSGGPRARGRSSCGA
jgi:hypothetical protein